MDTNLGNKYAIGKKLDKRVLMQLEQLYLVNIIDLLEKYEQNENKIIRQRKTLCMGTNTVKTTSRQKKLSNAVQLSNTGVKNSLTKIEPKYKFTRVCIGIDKVKNNGEFII